MLFDGGRMTISSFCRDQLLAHGPLPLQVLVDRTAHAGVTTARDPVAAVRGAIAGKEVLLADGRWATPLWLLEGRILTTCGLPLVDGWSDVGYESAADDGSLPFPLDVPDGDRHDLALIDAALRSSALTLASGGLLRRSPYGSGWRAPKGWPGERPGRHELLGLRVRDGQLHVERVPATRALRAAGEQLAHDIGRLDPCEHGWVSTDVRVSQELTAALWNRMAADPTFLTSPVPPLSRCIPSLAFAVRSERARRAEAASRWRPHLDLPIVLQDVAVREARRSGRLLDEWLSAFVSGSLRELDDDGCCDDGYGDVVPLSRGPWQGCS